MTDRTQMCTPLVEENDQLPITTSTETPFSVLYYNDVTITTIETPISIIYFNDDGGFAAWAAGLIINLFIFI